MTLRLCAHHVDALNRWRADWSHEDPADFEQRCQSMATQCPSCDTPTKETTR